MTEELAAWTPREDTALLSAKAKTRVHISPALQQTQWYAVAKAAAEATGAALRPSIDCMQRYYALVRLAKDTDKSRWPGGQANHELLQVALARDVKLVVAATQQAPPAMVASTRILMAALSASVPKVPRAVDGETSRAIALEPSTNLGKRPRMVSVLQELTLEHDRIILLEAADTTSQPVEPRRWHQCAARARAELSHDVLPSRFKIRYHELLQMNLTEIHARFGANGGLSTLLATAQAALKARCVAVYSDDLLNNKDTGARSTAVAGATTREQTQSDPVSTERHTAAAPPTSLAGRNEDGTANGVPAQAQSGPVLRPEVNVIMREPEPELAPNANTADNQGIAELKKTVEALAATVVSLRADADRANAERAQLKATVDRNQALGFVEASEFRIKLETHKRESARTVETLRTQLSQAKRDLLLGKELNKTSSRALDARMTSQSLELTELCQEVSSLRSTMNCITNKQGVLEQALQEADIQRKQQFQAFTEAEIMNCEDVKASLQQTRDDFHKLHEENRVSIEKLRKKFEENEIAERQRHVLLFEMVEAESAGAD